MGFIDYLGVYEVYSIACVGVYGECSNACTGSASDVQNLVLVRSNLNAWYIMLNAEMRARVGVSIKKKIM